MNNEFVELPYPLSRYVIRRDGLIIDTLTGLHVIPRLGPNCQYYGVTVWRDDLEAHSVTMHLHRLLAMTFVPVPEGYTFDQLQVDHIDGNKLNNSIENLQWVTQAENIRRAYATGLQTHENRVLIISMSGDRFEFRNQKLAAEFIGVNPGTLCEALNTSGICRGYMVKRLLC